MAYVPKRGDALMFFDVKPDYKTTDEHSMHTGCPVVAGVKWNAVKWIHGTPFRRTYLCTCRPVLVTSLSVHMTLLFVMFISPNWLNLC